MRCLARFKLEMHLINDCPLTTVNCDYHYAGCDAWLMRRDLNDHLTKHAKRHAALLDKENTLLFLDISNIQQGLYSTVSENVTCIEMNESLLQEQERLLKKTREDDNELSVVYDRLEEKDAEIKQLTKKLQETEERVAKATSEHKKALDQVKTKDSVLKTHTTAIKHYREKVTGLEAKLDEAMVETTKERVAAR